MEKTVQKFPAYIVQNFNKIPVPERKNILIDTGLYNLAEDFVPDDDMINVLEEAIRYKDAKVQLIRYMLEGLLMEEGYDVLGVREKALEFMNIHELDSVLDAYKKGLEK